MSSYVWSYCTDAKKIYSDANWTINCDKLHYDYLANFTCIIPTRGLIQN